MKHPRKSGRQQTSGNPELPIGSMAQMKAALDGVITRRGIGDPTSREQQTGLVRRSIYLAKKRQAKGGA